MSKFRVGDMVRVKKGLSYDDTGIYQIEELYCGKCFKIKKAFDKISYFLDIPKNYVFSDKWLEPVKSKGPDVSDLKIVIVNDGKTTNAILYKNGKEAGRAEAICHEDDEFDVMTGAKIALERLSGKEPEKPSKYHAGQIVRVIKDKMGHGFEIGSCAMLLRKEEGDWKAVGFCTDTTIPGIDTMYINENEFEAIEERVKFGA